MLNLDASGLVKLSCPRHFYLAVVRGAQSPQGANVYATFGNAVHKYAELLEARRIKPNTTDSSNLFLEVVGATGCTDLRLAECCRALGNWIGTQPEPLELSNGEPAVEIRFSQPSPLYPFAVHQGTMDRIHISLNDYLIVSDYKTSEMARDQDAALEEYLMTLQMRYYLWYLKTYYELFMPEWTWPLIRDNKLYGQYVGVFKNSKPVRIIQSAPIYFNNETFAEFEEMIAQQFSKAAQLYNASVSDPSYLPPPLGLTTNSCKYCQFQYICKTDNHSRRDDLIANLVYKPYEPLKFRD